MAAKKKASKKSPNLGGARPGSGRKPLPEELKTKGTKTLNLTRTVYDDVQARVKEINRDRESGKKTSVSVLIDSLLAGWLKGKFKISL